MNALNDVLFAYAMLVLNNPEANVALVDARVELGKLREKAAKWDKLQSDIAAGVIMLEMPRGDE